MKINTITTEQLAKWEDKRWELHGKFDQAYFKLKEVFNNGIERVELSDPYLLWNESVDLLSFNISNFNESECLGSVEIKIAIIYVDELDKCFAYTSYEILSKQVDNKRERYLKPEVIEAIKSLLLRMDVDCSFF